MERESDDTRNSVNRQAPLGSELYQIETATKYGILSTLNQRGRKRKDLKLQLHYFLGLMKT